MIAEFDWWLLILGLGLGGGLVWLVLADSARRDADIAEREAAAEAALIAARLTASGLPMSPEAVDAVLREHRAYLAATPPDSPTD